MLATMPAFAAGQTVWKWVDERGVTHYSDRPVPGATKMELNVGKPSADSPSFSSPRSSPSSAANSATNSDRPSGPPYRDLEIWRPADGDNIVNTGGAVDVSIRLEPALQAGHSLSLYLDGRLVESEAANATEYSLAEVPRGLHSLIAVVNDSRGERVQESATVRFSVRQTSIANPPVGPALRPPPKPRPGGAANKLPAKQPSYAALNDAPSRIDPATNLPVKPAPKPKTPKKP
jgi:hypothetical protein